MTLSLPQDPDTGYLHEGERISLDELAVHLAAAARWLGHLALAAETPAVPLELGDNLCGPLERMAGAGEQGEHHDVLALEPAGA